MADKFLTSRVMQKHDIEENWLKATNFVPYAGEIIVYDPDDNYPYPRIKVGDGSTSVKELPFSLQALTINEIDEICGSQLVHISEVSW